FSLTPDRALTNTSASREFPRPPGSNSNRLNLSRKISVIQIRIITDDVSAGRNAGGRIRNIESRDMRQYAITKLGCPARRRIAEHGGLHAAANGPRSIRCFLERLEQSKRFKEAKVETRACLLSLWLDLAWLPETNRMNARKH